ncbi:50S ribosomal protein L17 [Staphylococcus gallinarum]|uniref:50S ribosomal protein L17 n=1 Tax=Staphylococcus gallinarum TaxID=1293 RepID=A0A380FMK7_STAGA|nr:50S ribosomal protein L17 [Staphylococcus gallinarum]
MLRDLATSLIVSERVETTEARAKELRSVVEKLITLGKRGDLASRRQAAKTLRNVEILNEDETTQTATSKNYLVKSLNVITNVKVVTLVFLK